MLKSLGFPLRPQPPACRYPGPVPRQLRHQRAIRAEAYERGDGLWDIEACLTDHKPRDVALASGIRPQGLPIHELWLRVTIDRDLNVVDAEASSEWVPYPGHCQSATPAYQPSSLNLFRNFRRNANRLLAGVAGCSHLTELGAVLPTAAIQAFAGDVWNVREEGARGRTMAACTTKRLSSSAAAGRCGSTARSCGSTTRAGMARAGRTCPVKAARRNERKSFEEASKATFHPTLRLKGITHEDSRVPG